MDGQNLSLTAHSEHCAATGHMRGQGVFPGNSLAPGEEEVTVEELVEVVEEQARVTEALPVLPLLRHTSAIPKRFLPFLCSRTFPSLLQSLS